MMPDTAEPAVSLPPTLPGRLGSRGAEVAWPTIVGLITMGLCGVQLLGAISGIIWPYMMQIMRTFVPSLSVMFAGMQKWAAITVWSSVVSSMVFMAGMVLGSMLHERRRPARLLFAWAIVALLYSLVMVAITMLMQFDNMQMMGRTLPKQGNPFASSSATYMMTILTGLVQFFWQALLPGFLLVWLRRKSVRTEMERWR
jgi:hypothetical protein